MPFFKFLIRPFTIVACSSSSTLSFIIDHKCSIGLRSGEFPGHYDLDQNARRFFAHHSCVSLAVCAGAPSCIKIISDIFDDMDRCKTDPFFDLILIASLQVPAKIFVR